MARRRPETPARPPFWHRSRLGWVNALGFALTVFLGLWLLLALASNVMPGSDPIRFAFPGVFALVLILTQAATVALGAVVVFGFMMRGADFHTHKPRLYVFFWTCAGVLFSLCQMVTLLKFDWPQLPNAARWAEHVYWGEAFIGILCFGLMAYVNIDIPRDDAGHDDEDHHEHDEDDYAHEYDEHE